uniref:Glutathione S-transferase 3, mitochondrial n=1 Tax=Magallana gigas TaxID=29159 RepID=A0A8W8J9S6_MAGGI|nr:microsomal glutathione S-transferase 3 [Crassostrea gigas]|eukprot:XP_011449764.1 PREDICTED: microsomal glutathione S-transferase 3 [Crassostrea gigas]
MDATPIGLNADFGYVILVTISAIIMSWKVGYQVVSARKKFNVQYPKMYSEDDRFNCYQRAHQNTLEVFPIYLVLQIFSGIYAPRFSAVCGLIFVLGRLVYAAGYQSGDPKKRLYGTFAYIGIGGMFVCSVVFALDLLQIMKW